MKVWVVVEEMSANEDPMVVGVFSSLEECSKGIKAHVERLYGNEDKASNEIDSFEASLRSVDDSAAAKSSVYFDLAGCQIGTAGPFASAL